MQVLRDVDSIDAAIRSLPDPYMSSLMTDRILFLSEEGGDADLSELIAFVIVEPGDSLQTIDAEMSGAFLVNYFSGKRYGDPAFVPCFETLEEHATFYEMFFIQGGELGVAVLVPKRPDIDSELLALCARHATPATEPAP